MRSRLLVSMTAAIFLLVACGGDEGPSGQEAQDGQQDTPEVTAQVSRADLKTCLADAGLGPEDSGVFIIGSAGTNVEAIGVRLDQAGRTLLYVFDDADSAASQAEFAGSQSGGAEEAVATGNVAIEFEFAPSQAERDQINGCITG